jgi:3',5'-cyclic AMP phosphodiesterase CpdA
VDQPTLYAISDLHIGMADNRPITESLRPTSDDDLLIVAGDVGELTKDIEWALRLLASRFAKVIWAPGNHELWTPREDTVQLRGEQRYRHLVEMSRSLGVLTPEDPYPVWEGADGPVAVAPLFVLYDYSFRAPGTATKEESLARAYETGVVCTDEYLLHPDPYPSREAWCAARGEVSERRRAAHDPSGPLVRQPTEVLWHPEFAQWCGTTRTAGWPRRFTTAAVVYGHLHIPRTTTYDGIRHEEVSIGYPREWRRRGHPKGLLRQILPHPTQAPQQDAGERHRESV